jgi:hypothetical protein
LFNLKQNVEVTDMQREQKEKSSDHGFRLFDPKELFNSKQNVKGGASTQLALAEGKHEKWELVPVHYNVSVQSGQNETEKGVSWTL